MRRGAAPAPSASIERETSFEPADALLSDAGNANMSGDDAAIAELDGLPSATAAVRTESNRLMNRSRHPVQTHDDWRARSLAASSTDAATTTVNSLGGPETWRIRVSAELAHLDEHLRILDAAERARAARFRSEADRNRFVVARGSLRLLLGEHFGIDGASAAIGTNAFGKPLLLGPASALHFNTSHSGEWIVHAFDRDAPIGVDVETVISDAGAIAALDAVLSSGELGRLHALAESQRCRALTRAWVRKEAYVKAVGEGVSRPLLEIDIDLDARGHPFLRQDLNAASPARWQFDDLEFDEDHIGCVVSRNDVIGRD